MTNRKNRLADQTSPYLQQHADNPVDWYPWGEQALQKARDEDKPILLSIGYSACHWCHVMAHESFEDAATAKLMNALYINIKIDREERPDLDKIYQTAHGLLTQRTGGWPLTMILTPGDQIPFFGGTYFPETPRHGLPGFAELLRHVEHQYRQHRSKIAAQNDAMSKALSKIYGPQGRPAPLEFSAGVRARDELEQAFDSQHGGFGSAPKFPHPSNLEFLLHHWSASTQGGNPDQRTLHMAALTLKKMALGACPRS
ncbi:MAG: thioredoxin domain-containing protein [Gammaproteobacteria bacterium]|nr:thioredoxin domain-containing protein [Gammaproteobacteria bacterium]